jgi:hypothetical protein
MARFSLRHLRRSPGFTLSAVLALGGVEGVLLRPCRFLDSSGWSRSQIIHVLSLCSRDRGRRSSAPLVPWFSNRRSSTSHEVKDDGNDGQYYENVNKERRDVEHEKASQPQQE